MSLDATRPRPPEYTIWTNPRPLDPSLDPLAGLTFDPETLARAVATCQTDQSRLEKEIRERCRPYATPVRAATLFRRLP